MGSRRMVQFKKTVLNNGMTVVTEYDPRFESVAIGYWVRVGTRHEEASYNGISHFLEHMLFKGTQKRSALSIAKTMDQVGADFNAFTARDQTCFHVSVLKGHAKLAFEILNDVLLNSAFFPKEIEREKKVILQEISMIDESPEELVFDRLFEKIFEGHGLARPILGTEKTVRAMNRKKLFQFFYQNYQPENLVISVAGSLKHEEVLHYLKPLNRKQWIKRTPISPKSNAILKTSAAVLPELSIAKNFGFHWMDLPSEQDHVLLGIPAPPCRSSERMPTAILNLALGGGMSSHLFQEVREKTGLAYTVYSHYVPFSEVGLFAIYAGVAEGKIVPALKQIEIALRKLTSRALSKYELNSIKENLKASTLMSLDSVESRMMNIAQAELLLGQVSGVDQVLKRIQSVNADDVLRVARKLFQPDQIQGVFSGPRRSKKIKDRFLRQFYRSFPRKKL